MYKILTIIINIIFS